MLEMGKTSQNPGWPPTTPVYCRNTSGANQGWREGGISCNKAEKGGIPPGIMT